MRTLLALLAAPVAMAGAPTMEDHQWAPRPDQWIVQLDAAPLARRAGGARGRRLDTASAAARAHDRYLDGRQAQALQAAPGAEIDVEYRVAFAGFAARMSDDEAAAMRKAPGVRRVTRERVLEVTQEQAATGLAGSEPDLLGLPGGLWKRLGGPARAGQGVVVGIVDSGITPDAPSFADRGLDPPASWDGSCQGGQAFPVTSCSDKLIGARYFVEGIGEENLPDGVFVSPRDEAGHGTHVAAIAAGNRVDPSVGGDDLGVDRVSGVAPAAHLAVYKACWAYGVCSDVDVVAALDRAVADGVDVINLSLGGQLFAKVDPMQLAALNADAAGVVVVTSAGNSGELTAFDDFFPSIGTPAAAPWTTAVAASTGQRTFRSTVRAAGAGGGAVEAAAAMLGPGLPGAELVDARAIGKPVPEPRVPIAEGRNCVPGAFEPGQLDGKIVLCDYPGPFLTLGARGVIAQTVKDAGGVGIVLSWQFPDLPLWNWPLPVAVVKPEDARAMRELLAAGGPRRPLLLARPSGLLRLRHGQHHVHRAATARPRGTRRGHAVRVRAAHLPRPHRPGGQPSVRQPLGHVDGEPDGCRGGGAPDAAPPGMVARHDPLGAHHERQVGRRRHRRRTRRARRHGRRARRSDERGRLRPRGGAHDRRVRPVRRGARSRGHPGRSRADRRS
jgi:hypothetical protein